MTEKKEQKKASPIQSLQLAEHERREFTGFAKHGVSFKETLDPSYWSYIAERFVPFRTYVDLAAEDGSWVARLLVTDSGRTWAKMHTVYHHKLTDDGNKLDDNSDYEVSFAPSQKWRVIRKSDGEVIKKDMAKDEAKEWLDSYMKTIS